MKSLNPHFVFARFVNSAAYYGLTLAAGSSGGGLYQATALSGAVEVKIKLFCQGNYYPSQSKVPAYVLTNTLLRVLGRRRTLASFMLVGGLACLGIQLLAHSLPFIVPSLALLGKLSLAASFAVVYIHRFNHLLSKINPDTNQHLQL